MPHRLPGRARTAAAIASALIFVLSQAALLSGLVAPLAPASPAAAFSTKLTRYPYLTDVVSSNATINWATDRSATSGSVKYGVAGGTCATTTVTATNAAIIVGATTQTQYQWKAQLTGLAAGKQYCYTVFLGTTDLLAGDPTPTFSTPPAVGASSSYSFGVIGDWGALNGTTANIDQANLMSRIAASGIRFMVSTGDAAYPSGSQLNYGDLAQTGVDTSAVFGPSYWKVVGAKIPMFNAVGNHGFNATGLTMWPEAKAASTSGGKYLSETYCCTNGTTSASLPSAWYAFDVGNARFYVLTASWSDSNNGTANSYQNDYDNHWTQASAQYQWLKNDLKTHPTALKFAFFHYPMYSANNTEQSDTLLRGPNSLEGLLASFGVDIAFSGHAHIYQRNGAPTTANIVNYVTGGGGAKLEPANVCSEVKGGGVALGRSSNGASKCGSLTIPGSGAVGDVMHFLKVTVNGGSVTVTPTNANGGTFDTKSYTFSGGTDTTPPTAPTNLTADAGGPDHVTLTWTTSTDNVGVAGYDIYRNGVLLASVGNPPAGNTMTYSDDTTVGSTTYSYYVIARDIAGNSSPPSNTATVTTPPPDPTLVFNPTDDTYIQKSFPNNTAGSLSTLQVDNSPVKDILMKFNVTGLAGKSITGAKLRLWNTDPSAKGGDFFVAASTPIWTEAAANWNNAPAKVGGAFASLGAVAGNNWYSVDLSTLVTGDGVVNLRVSSTSIDAANYTSKEGTAANRPQLVVSYAPPDTEKPTAPTGVIATPVTSTRVDLRWTASTDNVGVTGYNIYRNGGATPIGTSTTTSFTDSAAIPGAINSYTVTALDAAKNESLPSAPADALTPPAAPTNLTATGGAGSITLNWTASAGATGYSIYRGITAGGEETTPTGTTVGGNSTSFTDTTVVPGIQYFYKVTATNGSPAGDGPPSNEASATATTGAGAPSGLSAAPGPGPSVSLTWTAPAPPPDSYTLKRSASAGGPYTTITTGITTTSTTDIGVSAGATYYYVVTAVTTLGESGPSNEAPITLAPAAPTGLSAAAGNNKVDLSWTASPGATGYKVFRHETGGNYTDPPPNGLIGSPSGTSFTDITAINGTQYFYVVRANNTGGDSADSNEVSATPAPPPAPPAPTGLSATPGNNQVALSWTASPGAERYKVFRRLATDTGYNYANPLASPSGTSFTDITAINGTQYFYVVRANNTGGDSADSNEVSATPAATTRSFVFSDGFETGNFSKWTTSGDATRWSFPSSPVHAGTKSALGSPTGTTTTRAYAKKDVCAAPCSGGYASGYFRTWVYVSPHTTQINLMRLRYGTDTSLGYLYLDGTGNLELRSDIGTTTWTSTTSVGTNGWHSLELHVTVNGATGGSSEVWLDDVLVPALSKTGVNWGAAGTNNISRIQIGEVAAQTWTVAFDDVAFDTAKIGLAPVP